MTLRNSSSDSNKKVNKNEKSNHKKKRDSFYNRLKEDSKRRIWPLVLFCLICFLMTAVFELNLESYIGRELAFAKIQANIERLTRDGMISTYLIVAGLGACLFGFQGFGWLMKKEQVDFYHSQPMKRGERFKIIYTNGVIMCFVPMFLHVIVYSLLIGLRGYLSKVVAINILINIGIFVIAYLVMYHLVILAAMLAGNILVAYMLAAIIFTYASIVKYLLEIYLENYFVTYVSTTTNAVSWLGYFSPVEQIYRVGNFFIRGLWNEITVHLLILAIMAVLFLGVAIWLYKKRPSEAAGNALAFSHAGDFIRFLIVIPVGMLFGAMFATFGVMSNIFWLYFGTIVGALLAHGFLEVVFHFDIKAAVKKKVQLAASVIFVLSIVSVFCFDIFGYDAYIPEENQVKAISYYINIGEYNSNYCVLSEDGIPVAADSDNQIRLEDITSADIFSYSSVEYTPSATIYRKEHQLAASRTEDYESVARIVRAHMNDKSEKSDANQNISMLVRYEMKNGREVYRQYEVKKEILTSQFEPIYETEEGKKIIYPYLNLSGKGIREVYIQNPFMREKQMELSPEEILELVECYKKDLRSQSLTDLMMIQYVGQVQFLYGKVENGSNTNVTLYIAENHKNMLDFFEEREIYFTLPNENYEIVEVTLFNPYGTGETTSHPFWQGREQVTLTPEQAKNLAPYMIPDEYYANYNKDYFLSGTMVVKNKKTGGQSQIYCNIPETDAPDYVK